jgi:hypothetical protein
MAAPVRCAHRANRCITATRPLHPSQLCAPLLNPRKFPVWKKVVTASLSSTMQLQVALRNINDS